ncbi:uncharacterized protein LOC128550939 [Mercenaria mercenaria]|uniref:uncharacterized protein LOC128550939 n=1 Tax=Mercenaria mercenaria TaxID=6596 RepID=UPI00234E43C1|nr:uncharacterized protein LOC128550939 [Mercenaria mercenaria]
MERCLTLIIGFICIICVSGQTTQKVCWDSKWYNDSGVQRNGSSYEHQSVNVLNTICHYGPVIAAKCKDDKTEPIKAFQNDTTNHYYATCNHVNGLICHPYNNSQNATCPDFVIQYGCNCPTTPSVGVSTASTQGAGNQSVSSGAGNTVATQGIVHHSTKGVENLKGSVGGITTLTPRNGNGVSGNEKGGGGSTVFPATRSGAGPGASDQQSGHCRNDGQHSGTSHLVLLLCTMTLKVLF